MLLTNADPLPSLRGSWYSIIGSSRRIAGDSRESRSFVGLLGLRWTRSSRSRAELLPADLEDRPPLAEMEVLQRHRLDQLREIELGQLVEDVGFRPLVTIRLGLDRSPRRPRARPPGRDTRSPCRSSRRSRHRGGTSIPIRGMGAAPSPPPGGVGTCCSSGRASPSSSVDPAWSQQVAPHEADVLRCRGGRFGFLAAPIVPGIGVFPKVHPEVACAECDTAANRCVPMPVISPHQGILRLMDRQDLQLEELPVPEPVRLSLHRLHPLDRMPRSTHPVRRAILREYRLRPSPPC